MSPTADIMVITDTPIVYSPGAWSDVTRRLESAGIDTARCIFTSVVKCVGKPWGVGKTKCVEYLKQEIEYYRPKAVITIGERAVLGTFKEKGHTKIIGSVKARTVGGHNFWSTHVHDSRYLDLYPEQVADDNWALSRALDICEGLYPRRPERHNNYSLILTIDEFEQWVREQGNHSMVAFDIEAGGTDPEHDLPTSFDPWHPTSYLIGVSLCTTPGNAIFIVTNGSQEAGLTDRIWDYLRSKWLICHNGKFDLNWVRIKTGIDLFPNFWSDTMLASHNLREWSKSHSLKWLASRWLPEFDGYEDDLDAWFAINKIAKNKRDFGQVPIETLFPYAACDADVTMRLYLAFSEMLQQQGLWTLHREHVMRMQKAYARMEFYGWGHNLEYWQALKDDAEQEKAHLLGQLRLSPVWDRFFRWKEWSMRNEGKAFWDEDSKSAYIDTTCMEYATGRDFAHKNGNRILKWTYLHKDVTPDPTKDEFKRTVLFGKDFFNLVPPRLTDKKKEPAVDAATLREVSKLPAAADAKAFIEIMMKAEKVNTKLKTFLIPAMPHWKGNTYKPGWRKGDGLIHSQYLLAGQDFGGTFFEGGTTSGRISSRDPNMTNQPTRAGGKKNKRQFVPVPRDIHGNLYFIENGRVSYIDPNGVQWVFIQFDYSQLELRILADLSGEEWMIQAYLNNEDLHAKLASQLFNRPVEWYQERLANDDHPEHDLAFNERLIAKTSWFAVIYGSGPQKLLDILAQQDVVLAANDDLALLRAKEIIADLYKKLPRVQDLKELVRSNAPVCWTEFSRRRTVLNVNSTDEKIASKGERQLFNFGIQSRGSDVASSGIFRAIDWLEQQRAEIQLRTYPTGAVHDSFLVSSPANEVDYVAHNIKAIMEDTGPLPWTPSIPFLVDVESGPTWGDLRNWTPEGVRA